MSIHRANDQSFGGVGGRGTSHNVSSIAPAQYSAQDERSARDMTTNSGTKKGVLAKMHGAGLTQVPSFPGDTFSTQPKKETGPGSPMTKTPMPSLPRVSTSLQPGE